MTGHLADRHRAGPGRTGKQLRIARSPCQHHGARGDRGADRRDGIEIVLLHVYTEESLPPFSDQLARESEAWAQEFVYPSPLRQR